MAVVIGTELASSLDVGILGVGTSAAFWRSGDGEEGNVSEGDLPVETLKPLAACFSRSSLSGTPISQEIESCGCSLSVDLQPKLIQPKLIGKE